VILAAVIGAFVLNLGGGQESPPQVDWGWEDKNNGTGQFVDLSHNGGDRLDNPDQIEISATGSSTPTDDGNSLADIGFSQGDGAGSTKAIEIGAAQTGTVELVWESSDGSQSQVIDSHEYDTTS
jgi:hypothetical protein